MLLLQVVNTFYYKQPGSSLNFQSCLNVIIFFFSVKYYLDLNHVQAFYLDKRLNMYSVASVTSYTLLFSKNLFLTKVCSVLWTLKVSCESCCRWQVYLGNEGQEIHETLLGFQKAVAHGRYVITLRKMPVLESLDKNVFRLKGMSEKWD